MRHCYYHQSVPLARSLSMWKDDYRNDSGMLMLGLRCQIIWLTFFRIQNVGFVLIKGPIVMIYVSRIKIFSLLIIKRILFVGFNTNIDLPASYTSNCSNFFQGETEERSLYFGSRLGVVGGDTWGYFSKQLFCPLHPSFNLFFLFQKIFFAVTTYVPYLFLSLSPIIYELRYS